MNNVLPSFPSLRARNLRTLYGNDDDNGGHRGHRAADKSPKGSVDERIRPLVDLINAHPDYVTLSSCSGRVALFDPGDACVGDANDDDDDDDVEVDGIGKRSSGDAGAIGGGGGTSGKGRGGRWIFVTHDVLPDLGERVVRSLRRVGRERSTPSSSSSPSSSFSPSGRRLRIPITFKHEPPLLHVAASSLENGMRLLRLCKSTCAMRESGLVVTDSRVTVEVRATSTALCVPLLVDVVERRAHPTGTNDGGRPTSTSAVDGRRDDDGCCVTLSPDEGYLMTLSGMANERMSRNGVLIDRLHRAVRETLFRTGADVACATAASTRTDDGKNDGHDCEEGDEAGVFKYKATLSRSLPPLNLWKTAAVVVRGVNGGSHDGVDDDDDRGNVIDVDVLAFGGQGIGPSESASAPAAEDEGAPSTGTSSRCRRHDDVFRLKRRGGAWSDRWEIMSRTAATGRTTATDAPPEADADSSADADPVVVTTSAGKFRIHVANEGMGRREGHAAVVVPPMLRRRPVEMERSADAVIVFGGRTTTRTTTTGEGGAQRSLSPSNDLFLFMMLPSSSPVLSKARILPSNCYAEEVASDRQQPERGDAVGLFGRPLDVRGTPPEPMYGFTMTALSNNKRRNGHPFAVLAGGTGFDRRCTPRDGTDDSTVCLASMYTLSCIAPDGCDGDDEEMEAFECSHFVWDRVADMPSPRSYHTSFVLEECNGNRNLIVFGGYEDSNDPFTSSASLSTSWFKAPLFFGGEDSINVVDVPRSDDTDAMLNIVVDNELLLPSRIGSSAVALCLESKIPVVLLVGGVKSTTSEPAPYSDSDHKHNGGFDGSDDGMAPPIILLAPQQKRHLPHDPIRMQSLFSSMSSSELEIVNSCDSSSSGSYDIDLGACVHHCLVALPRRQCDDDDDVAATSLMPDEDDPVSAIIVGGGVPSLSFGQSYARSYIVDVTRINVSSDAFQSNPAMHHKIIGFGAPNNTVASSSQCRSSVDKKINGRQPSATMTSHANVIYVNAHNAKDTKTVLESLGFLDKRYKMVKIKLDDQDDQLIAIPVTESFIDQSFADNEGGINSNDCTSRLKQWIVRRGTETVPFSSSLTGKMKQK